MDQVVQSLRNTFNTRVTRSVEWRKRQLVALEKLLDENEKEICESMRQDLNKPDQETVISEIGVIKSAIAHALDNIDEFVKPRKANPPLKMKIAYSAYVQYQPYGVVLVIGAWNYPYQLTLVPLVGAIASGNCVLIKPSELSESSAKLLEKLVPKYLDKNCIKVQNGGVSETIELLKQRFDYIMYTGCTNIGKSIMEAASKHMTPVTLECGGKSPVYIDSTTDFEITAKRIVWGRFSNAGQTCVAPDYVLCTKSVQDKIVPLIKNAIIEYYGKDAKASGSYARIVNRRHFNRVKSLIDPAKVYYGGETDESSNYVSPTIMTNVTEDDSVMKEEIFGPILPFVVVKDHNEAIDFINKNEKPLALYVFSTNQNLYDEFLERTSSGSYALNDCLVQCALECLPFGGVGGSGIGSYHGDYSFKTFSHERAVLKAGFFGDSLMSFRYPPYSAEKLKKAIFATSPSRSNKLLSKLLYFVLAAAALYVAFRYAKNA